MKRVFLFFLVLTLVKFSFVWDLHAKNMENVPNEVLKGYIFREKIIPLNLQVASIELPSLFLLESNLEDNSFIPKEGLSLVAEALYTYVFMIKDRNITIPNGTKFAGHITQIEPASNFNKEGYYKILFDEVTCPDGKKIVLNDKLDSVSDAKLYHPLNHVGKTVFGLVGGALAGSVYSYQLGGLPLILATNGYSALTAAALGGFVGTVSSIVKKGKEATIQPGDNLVLYPLDEYGMEKLSQINCPLLQTVSKKDSSAIDIEILSVKKKKDILGDSSFMVDIKFKNNTEKTYKLNNFYLRDSQGQEYSASIINMKNDIFVSFPPKAITKARLNFFVDYPRASHWLVLKDNNFTDVVGSWKIAD